MPHRIVVALAGLGLTLLAPAGPALAADPGAGSGPAARQALERASDLLAVPAPTGSPPSPDRGRDATLALRDLALALPRLSGTQRRQAEALLARPTDGRRDPYGDGYKTRAKRDCQRHVCLHWVTRTRDAAPDRRWVRTNQRVLAEVWHTEVGRLDFRRPLADSGRGGNRKLDVYLKELGSFGIYGYCAPEPRRHTRRSPGYCVLDEDFARNQFGRRPIQSLRVTAAHEFLHAVQFGYDYREDSWFLEATATWMEERYADKVDDNRQYLSSGQFGAPTQPLDSGGFAPYGNWAFFEYLSARYGLDVVRHAWELAGEGPTDGRTYSMDAVTRVVPDDPGFVSTFAAYAMALDRPAESFEEGATWGDPAGVGAEVLGANGTAHESRSLDHVSSRALRWRPGDDLDPGAWELQVDVDGPATSAAPVAGVVQVPLTGPITTTRLALDAAGVGQTSVPFDPTVTRAVHVVVGNASTRYRCGFGTTWSCHGSPRDDDRRFTVDVEVVPTTT